MKTILLTGATGFLGSHLLDALLIAQYNVIITKRTKSNCWRISDHLDSITSYDVDQIALEVIFVNHQIDIVIHTANCYGRNGESDFEVFKTNVLFSMDLLECAKKFNTDSFFNTDSLQYQYLNSYNTIYFYCSLKRAYDLIEGHDQKLSLSMLSYHYFELFQLLSSSSYRHPSIARLNSH